MNRILSLLIVLGIICGCSSNGKKEDVISKLNEAELKAEQSPEVEKEIFLGFNFGMTEDEVSEHMDSLKAEGKVKVDSEGTFLYDFHADGITLALSFIPLFFNDSLYRFDFPLSSTGMVTAATASLNTVMAANVFIKTDREGFNTFITEDPLGDSEYTFIKNNLIVKFHEGSTYGIMSYINAPVEKRLLDYKRNETDEKVNKTVSDF